jgi:hypothetical protein
MIGGLETTASYGPKSASLAGYRYYQKLILELDQETARRKPLQAV